LKVNEGEKLVVAVEEEKAGVEDKSITDQ